MELFISKEPIRLSYDEVSKGERNTTDKCSEGDIADAHRNNGRVYTAVQRLQTCMLHHPQITLHN